MKINLKLRRKKYWLFQIRPSPLFGAALRQYIDATMQLAPIDNGVQICSVSNVQILFCEFFSVRRASPTNAGWFGTSIGSARYKREKICTYLPRSAYSWGHCLLILVYLAETEIHKNKDDSKIKRQKNIDRHDPIPMPNTCHLPDPPWFLLQTTFKIVKKRLKERLLVWTKNGYLLGSDTSPPRRPSSPPPLEGSSPPSLMDFTLADFPDKVDPRWLNYLLTSCLFSIHA